jgi:HlyD family secretion protein
MAAEGPMFRDTTAQDIPVAPTGFVRRHAKVLALAVAALGALALFGPQLLRMSGIQSSIDASRITIATVRSGDFVRDIVADGRVVAASSPTIYAPSAGTVHLQVRAGDRVSAGQLLGRVESPDLRARLSQEQSSLTALQFDLQRAGLQSRREADAAREAHAQAEVDHTSAKREYERTQKAYELGAFSEMQLLRAQDTYEKSRFRLEQTRRLLDSAPEQGRIEAQGRSALVQRQKAVVEELAARAAALELRSPVDGQVGALQVQDRARVVQDAPLLSVVDLSVLEVEIQAPESLARDLATGMAAELSGNGGRWPGVVGNVSPEVVNGQVTARVRIEGAQPEGLRQNQRLTVRVLLEKRDGVLTVDRGSFADQGAGRAWRLDGDIAVRVPVRLGAVSISRVEILDGLREGDRVIVSGAEVLGNIDRVVVVQ